MHGEVSPAVIIRRGEASERRIEETMIQESSGDGRITPSRRRVIQSGLLAGLGLAAGGLSARGDQTDAKSRASGGSFRLAHLTDMHVEPGLRKAGEGWAAALK